MSLRIYGAGMAGLLTAAMLRRWRPAVHDAQEALPDNHGALLRFRTDRVERESGIRFARVSVLKAIKTPRGLATTTTLREANQYAHKVTGSVTPRSVIDLSPCERYIAPDDFCTMLARDTHLVLKSPLTLDALHGLKNAGHTVISTIPMPALMKIVGWPKPPEFRYRPIWSVVVTIQEPVVDTYQTIYYPDPTAAYYRASLTGNKLTIEYAMDPSPFTAQDHVRDVLLDFGIFTPHPDFAYIVAAPKRQEYGKLLPLPTDVRQEFMLAMTDQYNLYSVGRFATWRQILLDDVVQDVRRVETWINQRNSYQRRLDHVHT